MLGLVEHSGKLERGNIKTIRLVFVIPKIRFLKCEAYEIIRIDPQKLFKLYQNPDGFPNFVNNYTHKFLPFMPIRYTVTSDLKRVSL